MLRLIICKLLKKHLWKNEINRSLYDEGVDEFYRCKLCGKTKIKYMWDK